MSGHAAAAAETFQVYALRYAYRDSLRAEQFAGHDPRATEPMPMDYYVWLARSASHTVVVDTGFTRETARRRRREYVAAPTETLRRLGVDPEQVEHVVLTHLHYDHTGHARDFTAARYVLQESEMAFWTGRHARRGLFGGLVDGDDLTHLVRANLDGRIRWVDGDATVVPGVTVHHVGGHTPGMQVVRVATASGPVVLASDASHFYENIERDRPYGMTASLPGIHDAFDRVNELAGDPSRIVAGHDPQVRERFPAASAELAGTVVAIAG